MGCASQRADSDLHHQVLQTQQQRLSPDMPVQVLEQNIHRLLYVAIGLREPLWLYNGFAKCNAYVASDQMVNLLWEIEGQLPRDKKALLDIIDSYLSKGPMERLRFCLERRRRSFFSVYGGFPSEVQEQVQRAADAIDSEAPDAAEKVKAAIDTLKQSFI